MPSTNVELELRRDPERKCVVTTRHLLFSKQASLTINDKKTLVEGRDGGLFVNSEARGEVREGDWVTVDWDGTVHVNGKLR